MFDVIDHSGIWPESLFIYKVLSRATDSTSPFMAQGGFAQIYNGTYNSTKVAMKRSSVGRAASQDASVVAATAAAHQVRHNVRS
jgi:hypothetical protein